MTKFLPIYRLQISNYNYKTIKSNAFLIDKGATKGVFLCQIAAFIEIPWQKMWNHSWPTMGPILMLFRGSVTEWLPTPCIIHHTRQPIHRPPSLSNSHKLCARPAISTAEIWDACNYCAIYSNQLDPNLYFPAAPARLLASSYLPGRCSAYFCFLIRFPLMLFQQGGKTRSSCDTGFKKVKGSKL